MKKIITITALFFATALFAETAATENNETNATAPAGEEMAKCQASGKCGGKENMPKTAPEAK